MSIEDPFAVMARHLPSHGPERRGRPVSCYVALGDSFTAGTGCAPGERWADRLASSLRAANPGLIYRNLAQEGATSDMVLAQAGRALQLEPDLVTLVCGANDVLVTVRPDIEGYAQRLEEILDRLRSALPGVAILTATSPEDWHFLELGPRTRARVVGGIRRVNQVTREVAARREVPCFDVVGHPGLNDAANFAPDGLHPSVEGHARAAREFAGALHTQFGIDISHSRKEDL
jgi:phosphatidylinositol alpha 1,6-mannosyltransferase